MRKEALSLPKWNEMAGIFEIKGKKCPAGVFRKSFIKRYAALKNL